MVTQPPAPPVAADPMVTEAIELSVLAGRQITDTEVSQGIDCGDE